MIRIPLPVSLFVKSLFQYPITVILRAESVPGTLAAFNIDDRLVNTTWVGREGIAEYHYNATNLVPGKHNASVQIRTTAGQLSEIIKEEFEIPAYEMMLLADLLGMLTIFIPIGIVLLAVYYYNQPKKPRR